MRNSALFPHRLILKRVMGTGEMAQWWRILVALVLALSSITSTHVVSHNHLLTSVGLWHTHMSAGKTITYI